MSQASICLFSCFLFFVELIYHKISRPRVPVFRNHYIIVKRRRLRHLFVRSFLYTFFFMNFYCNLSQEELLYQCQKRPGQASIHPPCFSCPLSWWTFISLNLLLLRHLSAHTRPRQSQHGGDSGTSFMGAPLYQGPLKASHSRRGNTTNASLFNLPHYLNSQDAGQAGKNKVDVGKRDGERERESESGK